MECCLHDRYRGKSTSTQRTLKAEIILNAAATTSNMIYLLPSLQWLGHFVCACLCCKRHKIMTTRNNRCNFKETYVPLSTDLCGRSWTGDIVPLSWYCPWQDTKLGSGQASRSEEKWWDKNTTCFGKSSQVQKFNCWYNEALNMQLHRAHGHHLKPTQKLV